MGHCTWANMNEANKIYHDTEWGIPVHDDRQMFEHLTLECMQCGLSWDLMLKKREIFRKCFDDFDYDKIAFYDDEDMNLHPHAVLNRVLWRWYQSPSGFKPLRVF